MFACCQHQLQPLCRSLPQFRSRSAAPQPRGFFVATPLLLHRVGARVCERKLARAFRVRPPGITGDDMRLRAHTFLFASMFCMREPGKHALFCCVACVGKRKGMCGHSRDRACDIARVCVWAAAAPAAQKAAQAAAERAASCRRHPLT